MQRPLTEGEILFFSLTDLNGFLRELLSDIDEPVITAITDHRYNPDFVFNTLDRIKKYPSTFLKKQFDHFSTSLNPFELPGQIPLQI